ncbi:UNVERIFIED_CONTAM: hypothetical protein Sradi_4120400 [Sesamum radiatum]|uniref:Uncharacterized protein n=1 Tax=Sesamum radiatum TaxID=300843 RepID=A0AAW2P0V7_SESRA
MSIECPMETCIKSRIHLMSVAFHRRQTWNVYAILMGRLAKCRIDRTGSQGSSYGSLESLVGMTLIPGSDSTGVTRRLKESRQSCAHDDYILDLCER